MGPKRQEGPSQSVLEFDSKPKTASTSIKDTVTSSLLTKSLLGTDRIVILIELFLRIQSFKQRNHPLETVIQKIIVRYQNQDVKYK